MLDDAILFSGSSIPILANEISNQLKMPLGKMDVLRFNDGEIRVEVHEHVRGKHAYVLHSTSSPVNDNVMELVIITDALVRAGCKEITAVTPYFGYARQDRRPGFSRVPISSRIVANMIESSGISGIILVELHSTQQEGFFKIPMVNASSASLISGDIWKRYSSCMDDIAIVSPDTGGVPRARSVAKIIDNHCLVIIDKRRPEAGKTEVMNIIGDAKGKTCIIIDDMIDTGGTLCKGAQALIDAGAKDVVAYCTHPVLSGNAIENINNSCLSEIVVCDTIEVKKNSYKLRQISVANMLAVTIEKYHKNESISSIYV